MRRSMTGSEPTCARCAAPTPTPALCPPIWSRRCRARPRPARRRGAKRKADADFARVLPTLRGLAGASARVGRGQGGRASALAPYDALLDEYEPDGRAARDRRAVRRLAAFLPDFLQRVLERQRSAPAPVRAGWPVPGRSAAQGWAIALMERLGFDFASRPARRQPASVLRRHARRRAHHHPLRARRISARR